MNRIQQISDSNYRNLSKVNIGLSLDSFIFVMGTPDNVRKVSDTLRNLEFSYFSLNEDGDFESIRIIVDTVKKKVIDIRIPESQPRKN